MTQKSKIFTQSPLPFMGQKRRFLKQVKDVLNGCPDDAVYVDLFGGSGLLSHTVKQHYPNATVVYNDYDNYRLRLQNVDKTNKLIADIRLILANNAKDKRIQEPERSKILGRVLAEEKTTGYVDYITLSSSILFSMKYVQSYSDLEKETLYNCIRQSDYTADGYLDGLVIESSDYKELFLKYKTEKNVVFLVDPPYLSTEVGTYKNYWKLKDYLDVLDVLDGTNYLYFTSNKSQIVELCEWMSDKPALYNPFAGSTTSTVNNQVNFSASYTDIMLHKINYEFK
ncbi:DNA adenine methylase [Flavobacterium columnare]|uniref:DNA adenine methylase n=1 Tax=Flavobacterium columnare TaxID=996 RepID=A0AAI8GA21_9FLAO|nr:DNA adenine methylase [Flavobacterium columnare]AMO19243.1 DNA adenine methylase [Flavobacterium columnare]AUX17178.1 DNA methyltransferase [Flavobacterium columnare]QOG56192.1 DNA adenine methylase [Flavobacterium columnare]QOG58915.1 DNA adenine methylase [Flavobacterium columnare]QOG61637.1 DNA adenine methylase [Flavobacterium columnare]